MSKVIYSVAVSIDGFIAAPDGSFDWLLPYPPDDEFATFLEGVGGLIMGRASFDQMLEMDTEVYPDRRVAVMTSRHIPIQPANVAAFSGDTEAALAWLRAGAGDIWLFGGGKLAGQLLLQDTIDELHMAVVPVTLGMGCALFGEAGFEPRDWALADARPSASGYLMCTYRRQRA